MDQGWKRAIYGTNSRHFVRDRAAGTRSVHDGACSCHTGTPRPDRRSCL